MAENNSINTVEAARHELFDASTTVEEAANLLHHYIGLALDSCAWPMNNLEASKRAQGRLYALLLAARGQERRLVGVPEAIIQAAGKFPREADIPGRAANPKGGAA